MAVVPCRMGFDLDAGITSDRWRVGRVIVMLSQVRYEVNSLHRRNPWKARVLAAASIKRSGLGSHDIIAR